MNSFTSTRLSFRPIIAADKNFFVQQYTNANIMRHNGGALTTADAIEQHSRLMRDNLRAQNNNKKTILSWAIVCKNTQDIIGIQTLSFLIFPYNSHITKQAVSASISLNSSQALPKINQAEVGIILAQQHQNKGFAQEALSALIHYSFSELALDKVNAFYNSDNILSEKLFTRLGFKYDANLQARKTNKCYFYLEKP